MFFAVAAMCFQAQTDYLVVDGLLVGTHSELGWSRPKEWQRNIRVSFTEVSSSNTVATFTLGPSKDATVIVALDGEQKGVFFSGKIWNPRTASVSLNRDSALERAALFARNRGVRHPQPYLTGVWDVDVDGTDNPEQIIEVVSHPRVRRGQAQESDWQAVLLRWRNSRQERLYPLHFSFPKDGQELAECRLRAIADFDGDGNLDVVTTSRQSNTFAVTLWSFSNGKLVPTLDTTYQVDALSLG